MGDITAWLESAGLPTGNPVELVGALVALAIGVWFLMHLLFD